MRLAECKHDDAYPYVRLDLFRSIRILECVGRVLVLVTAGGDCGNHSRPRVAAEAVLEKPGQFTAAKSADMFIFLFLRVSFPTNHMC